MKRTATIVNLCFWLVVTLVSCVIFGLSRSSQTSPELAALSIVAAPCIACGIGAVLGCVVALVYRIVLRRWVRWIVRLAELILLVWFVISFFSMPAVSEGVALPPFVLSVLFHSFPMLFVLWGFACGPLLSGFIVQVRSQRMIRRVKMRGSAKKIRKFLKVRINPWQATIISKILCKHLCPQDVVNLSEDSPYTLTANHIRKVSYEGSIQRRSCG